MKNKKQEKYKKNKKKKSKKKKKNKSNKKNKKKRKRKKMIEKKQKNNHLKNIRIHNHLLMMPHYLALQVVRVGMTQPKPQKLKKEEKKYQSMIQDSNSISSFNNNKN